jgi:hypothetical protein
MMRKSSEKSRAGKAIGLGGVPFSQQMAPVANLTFKLRDN